MALVHHNLVSLWDPDSLSLVKQVVGPSSNDLTFLAFVDPQPNSGEAYLIFSGNTSISIMDLLTTKILWSAFGCYSLFTASVDGRPLLTTKAGARSWFACVSESHSYDADSCATDNEETEDQDRKTDGNARARDMLLFFAMSTSQPVLSKDLPSRALSLSALRAFPSVNSRGSVGRLLVTLANGQIVLVQDKKFEGDVVTEDNIVQRHSNEQASGPLLFRSSSEIMEVSRNTKSQFESDMVDVLSLNSQSLPSVSSIFDKFLRSVVNKQTKESPNGDVELNISSNTSSNRELAVAYQTRTDIPEKIDLSAVSCIGDSLRSFFSRSENDLLGKPTAALSIKTNRKRVRVEDRKIIADPTPRHNEVENAETSIRRSSRKK